MISWIKIPSYSKPAPVSADDIRQNIGTLYYQQAYIFQGLASLYYLLLFCWNLFTLTGPLTWALHTFNLAILFLLFALYILEKKEIVDANNIYLTPIPIAIAIVINIQSHVIILNDADMLLRSILAIVAFGIVSMLPWIFWLLVTISASGYFLGVYFIYGIDNSAMIVLGVGAIIISYAGFAAKYNAVRTQVHLTIMNQKRAEKMEHLAKTKDDFIANMNHELRTPLTGLTGMIDLLQDAPLRAEDKHHLQVAKNSATTLRVIINDILDLSKLDASKLTLKEEDFNFQELATEINDIMMFSANKKGIDLTLKMPELELPTITGDPVRLRQIFFNLVGNAIKFTFEGQVVITISRIEENDEDITLNISVEDTGVGIEQKDLIRLFERFEQIDSSFTRKQLGTGLGLTISQELAKLMATEIKVTSIVGKGSRFWFTLKFNKAKNQVTKTTSTQKNSSEADNEILQRKFQILVAEDNPVNQLLIRKLLEKKEWQPVFAINGEDALALAKKTRFDFILMDIQMPKMTGDEVVREIRHTNGVNRDTIIIGLTANYTTNDLDYYKSIGMTDCIAKPIDIELFYKTIAKHIEAH